jgi:hypothetical protein
MLAYQNEHTLFPMVPEQRKQLSMPESKNERPLRPAQIVEISTVHDANPPGSRERLKEAPPE